jgi:hypothetical protein
MAAPNSEIVMTTPLNYNFTFDNFGSYNGGITYTGATVLKIKTRDLSPADVCHWRLKMHIHTNHTSGTSWDTTAVYGSGDAGVYPPLDLLSVRVYNACGTPFNNLVMQNFPNANDAELVIIDDAVLNLPGPPCSGEQVNAAGSYLSNYGEYTFNIDYRIKPGTVYTPGRYEISVWFCLSE